MEIKEIPVGDFDSLFPERPTAYDSATFNLLNAPKVERIIALTGIDSDGRPMIGQIFGLRNGLWRAPFSAPFSAPSVIDGSCRDELIKEFYAAVPKALGSPLRLVWPSAFYRPGIPPIADEIVNEANFHYEMERFADFEAHLSRSGRYNHHRAQKHDFSFFKTDDIDRAYAIIAENRRAMGYPLAMTLDQVKATVAEAVRADFFVMTLDNSDVAAAMLYEASEGIMQVIYWGDLPVGRPARAMNHLAWQVFGWYAANRPDISTIDIGPASSDGIRNEGLCQFKLSIGCIETPRPTLLINNY